MIRGCERGPNKGLVGCGIRVKMEVGYRITEILLAGYGIEILWQEQDQLILTDKLQDSFKIEGGILDERRGKL